MAFSIRRLSLAMLALPAWACVCGAQTAPVQAVSAIPLTAPTVAAATPTPELPPGQRPPHHARVTWEGGMLTIDADNSSLNQILREICRETGMRVTGGVADERVFGSYGPALPEKVLDDLLDGTGSNLMLLLNDQAAPAELILTPRHGGVSPPGPQALPHDDDRDAEDLPPQRIVPRSRPEPPTAPVAARDALSNPAANAVTPSATAANPAGTSAPTTTASTGSTTADTTTQQSPNGVKTPQQIYEQLLKLQQKSSPGQTTPQ